MYLGCFCIIRGLFIKFFKRDICIIIRLFIKDKLLCDSISSSKWFGKLFVKMKKNYGYIILVVRFVY